MPLETRQHGVKSLTALKQLFQPSKLGKRKRIAEDQRSQGLPGSGPSLSNNALTSSGPCKLEGTKMPQMSLNPGLSLDNDALELGGSWQHSNISPTLISRHILSSYLQAL